MLLHLRHVLLPAELARARALLADPALPWADGRESAGTQAAGVKRNLQLPHACAAAAPIREAIVAALDQHADFLSAALPKRIFPPRINRYGGAAPSYGEHVDGAIRLSPLSRERVRTDISCTVFLSDPGEYDGGELVIQHGFGAERIKLAAGDAVLYPGTSVHEVTPVTRGERLAAFFWIESLVRSDEDRALLYQMDQALRELRGRHGKSAATVRLTGTYHNLLRRWADT